MGFLPVNPLLEWDTDITLLVSNLSQILVHTDSLFVCIALGRFLPIQFSRALTYSHN